ncbi:uncharacterized protein IWZ02DRAFT_162731 [Phyllosticta citriasiana]|uniref:uncharacterized protein n=1 Tax=Phyllosticta citriasiana TaxID=595635 RepID=UPI0030FD4959
MSFVTLALLDSKRFLAFRLSLLLLLACCRHLRCRRPLIGFITPTLFNQCVFGPSPARPHPRMRCRTESHTSRRLLNKRLLHSARPHMHCRPGPPLYLHRRRSRRQWPEKRPEISAGTLRCPHLLIDSGHRWVPT